MVEHNTVAEEGSALRRTNQNIKGRASRSLLRSSTAPSSDQGSQQVATPAVGEEEEHPEPKWYYMFLHMRDFSRFIDLFTGKTSLTIRQSDGSERERYFHFVVFAYTTADHRRRLDKCALSKEDFARRSAASETVEQAFVTGDERRLNTLVDASDITGNGYLFVCAPLDELQFVLSNVLPRHYLINGYKTMVPATIPDVQMREFIYLYESMPYNIELMEHPLDDYKLTKQKIRITAGLFKGKEGYLMRLHKKSRLAFSFGNMTIAISYIHAFPYEKVEEK